MNRKKTIEFIEHTLKPVDIWIATREARSSKDNRECRRIEKTGGRELVSDIVSEKMGNEDFTINSADNEKPVAEYGGRPVHISIAHSKNLICGAVSAERVLGVDLEPVSRNTVPGLKNRILHPDEIEIIKGIAPLRLWTIKEAALKWSGSGLRVGMNTIQITSIRKPLFYINFPDGKYLEICSFKHKNHWISIAYEKK